MLQLPASFSLLQKLLDTYSVQPLKDSSSPLKRLFLRDVSRIRESQYPHLMDSNTVLHHSPGVFVSGINCLRKGHRIRFSSWIMGSNQPNSSRTGIRSISLARILNYSLKPCPLGLLRRQAFSY